jgi:hypothetical protein
MHNFRKDVVMAVRAKGAPVRRTTRVTKTPKGMSLHVGLDAVDPNHYAGWSGPLFACEYDANDMAAIAASRAMMSSMLLTRDATRANVRKGIRAAAKALNAGDLFFLTYSGHGGQVDDVTNDEADSIDETWCLFDGQLIDDELYLELNRFRKGVRILVLSDSCHSGTVTRAFLPFEGSENGRRTKHLPPDVARETYRTNKRFYDTLQLKVQQEGGRERTGEPDVPRTELLVNPRLRAVASKFNPMLILVSGCQDNQTSMDGDRNGAFTERLKAVWKNGAFTDDYARFHARIKSGMPPSQTPNLFVLGDATAFLRQRPFDVVPKSSRVSEGTARRFVADVRIPAPRAARGAKGAKKGAGAKRGARALTPETDATTTAMDAARLQAAIVGSEIVSFASNVPTERREAIMNSTLLAQLVAKKKVADQAKIYDWYNVYFDTLTNLGWVIQDQGFAEYEEKKDSFEAHTAILAVATTLLGSAPTALAGVTSAINALHKMDESTPWITLFNRESGSARTARFQVSVVEQDEEGQFHVTLMAFGLEAKGNVTQVLFFKAKKSEARLRHYSGRVTINTGVLDAIAGDIKAKLIGQASEYVKGIPDFS